MEGSLRNDGIYGFILTTLLIFSSVVAPVSAALKSATWQELRTSTDAINGTVPMADGATIPVYQGSILLASDKVNNVSFSAMPRDFSTDDTPSALQLLNPVDSEGDIFAVPPVRWEKKAPEVTLTWANAATPDVPLNPQPVANRTFCAQDMAGKQFVIWPQVATDSSETPSQLYLQTTTGTPFSNTVSLLAQKIPVSIAAAAGDPVTVVASHLNESLNAAKVKAGESITLTITTRDCQGNAMGNTAFVITRGDALNRQGVINNGAPVHVGDTELTTTTTQYHGTTDADGNATVVVTQANGSGVKTPLTIYPANATTLTARVDVIFTTLTSPDSPSANMWGHMEEQASAVIDGENYTFSRPVLAAESDAESGTVMANNERWALFDWQGADNHCVILPDARQLVGFKVAKGDLAIQLGWPVAGTNEYWSASEGTQQQHHMGVNMLTRSVVEESDNIASVVSCVDKASPAVTPELTLTLDNMDASLNAAKVRVGESISMKVTVTNKATGEPLPYRYFDLYVGDAQNRKGQTRAQAQTEGAQYSWDDNPVRVDLKETGTPNHYQGITRADGQFSLTLTQDNGAGVLTPLRVVLADGTEATANVIFSVVTSPDLAQARMWGHMQGVVEASNIYKRPLLASEARANTGSTVENHEDWATFNSVAAATAQCGTHQVPGQVLLDALYSAHPGNAMLTTYGWPTASYSYISADTDGTQTTHVNLANGHDSSFSATEPNFVTCSGNELATQLDVSLNGDTNLRQAIAKVGEQITLTVHSVNALNGFVVPNAAFTVTMAYGKNRSGQTTGFTDASAGTLVMAGESFGPSQASMIYQGTTDASGNASVIIEQPQGVGLLTSLTIAPVNSLITTPIVRSVKFTVPTSPDTLKAQMWGHMAETVTVGGLTFERPRLATEVNATHTQDEDNETWARVIHTDAAGNTAVGGCGVNRLPRADQLSSLYNANSGGAMHTSRGWPVAKAYWSATFATASTWQTVSLGSGAQSAEGSASNYTSCLSSDNPVAATISIEAVNAAQWNESLQAAKVKKGETLVLKVTVKDANGNPLPDAPFVLSRGDGYTRQNVKHIAGSGDGIVSPVVIDGESLNDTATKIGGITGADGSKIINVTRPDTHGTRVAINAALYDNASISDNIATLFTVVTSPDSEKAAMWGHMPESVTAANGAVLKRPLLLAEVTGGVTVGSQTENNESWATVDFESIKNACGATYVPSFADLQSLYAAQPGGAMNVQQGWPLDGKNYQNSTADLSRSTENRYVKSLNLRDNSMTSQLWSEKLYYSCLKNAHSVATHLTLTSSSYTESDGAAKVKVGETIPVVITALDDSGHPVANTPIIFMRGDSTGRSNQEVNATEAATIQINHGEGRQSGVEYYTATGDDGTLTLEINQDGGAGFKTPLQAAIDGLSNTTQSLPVIFTVVTSPDTAKANYWGHMPETVTDSTSVVYQRPLLASEFSATPGRTVTLANGSYDKGETWGMVTISDAIIGTKEGCGDANLPTTTNLQALQNRYPDGAMRSTNGWPVTSSGAASASQYWWAGNAVVSADGSHAEYATVNLLSGGDITTTTSTSTYYMQTCLATPRSIAASVMLTLSGQDESSGIATAKAGEKIAATVTVKNAAGQAVSGALVKISRGDSVARSGTVYSGTFKDDITLSDILPSGLATFLLSDSSSYMYVQTNAQGQATFNVSQNNTMGLQTAIYATLPGDTTQVDSKQARFTVVTSPDTDKAMFWGHMPETFTNSKGVEFKRPLLRAELSSTQDTNSYTMNGETWWYTYKGLDFFTASNSPCDRASGTTVDDLQTLQRDYPQGGLMTQFGLPVNSSMPWIASEAGVSYKSLTTQFVDLYSGAKSETAASGQSLFQLCRVAPRTLKINITSTNEWDESKAGYVAQKGQKIPLTISVTNEAGQQQPGVAIGLTRGSSMSRSSGTGKPSIISGDDMRLEPISPASSSSFSLQANGSIWYGVTGDDGNIVVNVSQDKSTGLKTELYGQLVDTGMNSSSVYSIFTVVTSPDVDGAFRWGHMPETVPGADGVIYQRPKLQSESPSGVGQYYQNNEFWAYPTAIQTKTAGATSCDRTYQPLLSDLQALYAKYPNGELETTYGWPLSSGKSWWAGDLSSDEQYQSLNLSTGQSSATSSESSTAMQTCRTTPAVSLPATIELTSSVFDETNQWAKVKKGEAIPVTITVKDMRGKPMANTAVTLTRGDGLSRSGDVKTSNSKGGSDDIAVEEQTPVSASTVLNKNTSTFSVMTGVDGTATLILRQDNAMGLKTTLTAKVTNNKAISASMDVIFTILTSPDSDKAVYWGHMPETFSTSSGIIVARPRLLAELSSTNGAASYSENSETWARLSAEAARNSENACSQGELPLMSELQTLYNEYPSGSLEKTTGFPGGAAYMASDPKRQGSTVVSQALRFDSGAIEWTSSISSSSALVLCWKGKPHPHPANILISTADWDTERSAIYVNGTETTLTALVTSKNGEPIEGAVFTLTRSDDELRTGERASTLTTLNITPVSPKGGAMSFSTGLTWYGVTDSKGEATLTIKLAVGYPGTRIPLTFTLSDVEGEPLDRSLIFVSSTSPDTDKAQYWGNMPDTAVVNGKVIHRPPLVSEVTQTPAFKFDGISGNELWAQAYSEREGYLDVAAQCGAMENLATLSDLSSLDGMMKTLKWPKADYLAPDQDGNSCAYNMSSHTQDCRKTTSGYIIGFAACAVN